MCMFVRIFCVYKINIKSEFMFVLIKCLFIGVFVEIMVEDDSVELVLLLEW